MINQSIFESAVLALIGGDAEGLRSLLRQYPALVHTRSTADHQASLFHYLGANGVENEWQKTPPNALEMAQLLVEFGADVNALAPIYGTEDHTLELLVSSWHPFAAGLQADLAAYMIAQGAPIEGRQGNGAPLGLALGFGYRNTAERLAALGARHDNLIFAAGLGKLNSIKDMLDQQGYLKNPDLAGVMGSSEKIGRFSWPPPKHDDPRVIAFLYACLHGRDEVVLFFLDLGISPNASASYGQTGLHFAALAGHESTVRHLIEAGAITHLADTQVNRSPADWAREGGEMAIAHYLEGMSTP